MARSAEGEGDRVGTLPDPTPPAWNNARHWTVAPVPGTTTNDRPAHHVPGG
jgi:hypothetical protein